VKRGDAGNQSEHFDEEETETQPDEN